MQRMNAFLAVFLLTALTLIPPLGGTGVSPVWATAMMAVPPTLGALAQDAAQVGEIKITAKKYEFDPSVVTVKKGERVKLVITALDHDHGFKLEAFQINERLKKGVATTVELTADKVGTFPFECSHFCGVGHGKMKGKLVVTE